MEKGEMAEHVKGIQEQATATVIGFLNEERTIKMFKELSKNSDNTEKSLELLAELKNIISNPDHLLGSDKTKLGEMAEFLNVFFNNADAALEGAEPSYNIDKSVIGRTSDTDYLKDGKPVQSKYSNDIQRLKRMILEHSRDNPDFLQRSGSYDISKDTYEKMQAVLEKVGSGEALSKEEERIYRIIKELEEKGIDFSKIHPGAVKYDDALPENAQKTVSDKEEEIREKSEEKANKIRAEHEPSFGEGVKVAALSGLFEGGLVGGIAIAKKIKSGKRLSDFTADDWKDVGIESSKSAGKGAMRGGAVYYLSNFADFNPNIASAIISASFGIFAQIKSYRNGEIDADELVENSEIMCLDVAVSTLSSLVGGLVIPVPVLGPVVGSIVGEVAFGLAKAQMDKQELILIENLRNELNEVQSMLDKEYRSYLHAVINELQTYLSFLQIAFDEDNNIAFKGSINLAVYLGIKKDDIIKSREEADIYFLT